MHVVLMWRVIFLSRHFSLVNFWQNTIFCGYCIWNIKTAFLSILIRSNSVVYKVFTSNTQRNMNYFQTLARILDPIQWLFSQGIRLSTTIQKILHFFIRLVQWDFLLSSFFLRRPTLRLSATQNACDEVSVNLCAYIFTYLHMNVLWFYKRL